MLSPLVGIVFLLAICIVVGTSTLFVAAAFGDAIQGKLSPTGFSVTTLVAAFASVGTLQALGFAHTMLNVSVALTLSAIALLCYPFDDKNKATRRLARLVGS